MWRMASATKSPRHIWHRDFPVSPRETLGTLVTLLADHESCHFSEELLPDRLRFPAELPTDHIENGVDDNRVMGADALLAEADIIVETENAKEAKPSTESKYSCD